MNFEISKRLKSLPPYLFLEIDKSKRKAIEEGRDIIDLGVGDPDLLPDNRIIERLQGIIKDPLVHHYALDRGIPELREAISNWYKRRFNVDLDPETEVLPLIGSKEGIAHLPFAFVDPRDYVLVPDPCYPPYKSAALFSGGIPYPMPLLKENGFLPDLKEVHLKIRKKIKLMFLNYPNNPTSATAESDFFKKVISFAFKYGVIVAHDFAYSEISFDGYRPTSFLEIEGSKDIGIEFHSFSKTFNMPGWRLGFVCGNKDIIAALTKIKSNIDSGIFSAIQLAGAFALERYPAEIKNTSLVYQERRDILFEGLKSLGLWINKPKATFYLWAGIPKKYNSISFSKLLLEKANVIATPGVGFGKFGEGYVRFSLTTPLERIKEAVARIKGLKI